MEADKNSTFMDVCNNAGTFALNPAFVQVGFAGVVVDTLDIRIYKEAFRSTTKPVPGQISGKNGAFHTKDFYTYYLFGNSNNPWFVNR